MAVEKLVAVGTERGVDIFARVLEILEKEKPSVLALDENPIDFTTLVQMRTAEELYNEEFVLGQNKWMLKRELDIGCNAGILYAMRNPEVPIYFVDGSFSEVLSEKGEETGVYPYFTSLEFACTVDLMKVPIELHKARVPLYAGWDFDYELIHSYLTSERFRDMDRALRQRNRFTAQALNRIIEGCDRGVLGFIGNRKRFNLDLYRRVETVTEKELSEFKPLLDLVRVKEVLFYDVVREKQ